MADQREESYRLKGAGGMEKKCKKMVEDMELRLKEWWSGEMYKWVTTCERAAAQKSECQHLKAMVAVMTEEAERGHVRRRLELVQWEREKQAYEETIAELRDKIQKYKRENEEAEASNQNRPTDGHEAYNKHEWNKWEPHEKTTRNKNIVVKGACVSDYGIENDITEFIRRNMYTDPKIERIQNSPRGWVVTLGSLGIKKAIMRQKNRHRVLEFSIDDDLTPRANETVHGTSFNGDRYRKENYEALVEGGVISIVPQTDCPHVDTIADTPRHGIDVRDPCRQCRSTIQNWICLSCYTVYCSRNVNRHALTHGKTNEHPLTLSLNDLSVWCYDCEAYVDNPRLSTARNAARLSKLNHELSGTHNKDSARARE